MAYELHLNRSMSDPVNVLQVSAIELALGISLPRYFPEWPTGLITSWNDAAEEGQFKNARTIADASLLFLIHRIKSLP